MEIWIVKWHLLGEYSTQSSYQLHFPLLATSCSFSLECVLKCLNGVVDVEVVGRLIQHQQVWSFHHHLGEGQSDFLSVGECVYSWTAGGNSCSFLWGKQPTMCLMGVTPLGNVSSASVSFSE